uniref:C2H2-type domain-containing protein n=1 Tax=Glossina brevipalpis TaxID=37001 RepID=A0A1A9X4B0_9MUSC
MSLKRQNTAIGLRLAGAILNCNKCDRSFAKMEILKRHKKQAHTMKDIGNISLSVPECTQSEDKEITCSHCPLIFMRRNNYVRHLIIAHPDEAGITPEDREMANEKHDNKNDKKGLCYYCGKIMSISTFSSHLCRHTGKSPCKCIVCSKGFPKSHDLLLHGRKHTGEKRYVYSICDKSFPQSNTLARDMRIHTGERPYKCSEYTRSFVQSNHLKIHTRHHLPKYFTIGYKESVYRHIQGDIFAVLRRGQCSQSTKTCDVIIITRVNFL